MQNTVTKNGVATAAGVTEAVATFGLVTGTFGAAVKDSLIKDYATAQ